MLGYQLEQRGNEKSGGIWMELIYLLFKNYVQIRFYIYVTNPKQNFLLMVLIFNFKKEFPAPHKKTIDLETVLDRAR